MSVMVAKDRTSTAVSADVVPQKGVGGAFAPKQLDRVIKRFGHHGKVVLKSDGEPAIKVLLNRVEPCSWPEIDSDGARKLSSW